MFFFWGWGLRGHWLSMEAFETLGLDRKRTFLLYTGYSVRCMVGY